MEAFGRDDVTCPVVDRSEVTQEAVSELVVTVQDEPDLREPVGVAIENGVPNASPDPEMSGLDGHVSRNSGSGIAASFRLPENRRNPYG